MNPLEHAAMAATTTTICRNIALALVTAFTLFATGCEADDSSPLPPAAPIDASADHASAHDAQSSDHAAAEAGMASEAGAGDGSVLDGGTDN
jgi:hypothetical protein